jgi:hypothetical protein
MTTRIRWAPRVPMDWLRRLYEQDAAGVVDDELIDKVGYRLYERARDCIVVSENARGRITCPMCRAKVDEDDDRFLTCSSCGWSSDYASFHKSWQHMELVSTGIRDFLEEFIAAWDRARTSKQKMLAIDRLIHKWHWENVLAERGGGVGRPAGVNLIEGSRKQVLQFLENLSAGPAKERWQTFYDEVRARGAKTGQ